MTNETPDRDTREVEEPPAGVLAGENDEHQGEDATQVAADSSENASAVEGGEI